MNPKVKELGELYKAISHYATVTADVVDRSVALAREIAATPDPAWLPEGASEKEVNHLQATAHRLLTELDLMHHGLKEALPPTASLTSRGYYARQALQGVLREINNAALVHDFDIIEEPLCTLLLRLNDGKVTEEEAIVVAGHIARKIFTSEQNPWELQMTLSQETIPTDQGIYARVARLRQYRVDLMYDLGSLPMTIAIDYEGVLMKDPTHWKGFIKASRARGHRVYIVTMMHNRDLDTLLESGMTAREEWSGLVDGIIATAENAKQWFCKLNFNVAPDIWIESDPASVLHKGKLSKALAWRTARALNQSTPEIKPHGSSHHPSNR